MTLRVKSDFTDLKKLAKSFKDTSKMETRVGILSDTTNRQDGNGSVTNAGLGMVHEFGSHTKGIPARSFLRMPIEQKTDDIKIMIAKKQQEIEEALASGKDDVLFTILGLACENVIQMAFESRGFGQWQPVKAQTAKRKGSNQPLIDSGQLRESIISKASKK